MNHTLTGANVQLNIARRIEVHRVDGASEVDRLALLLDLRRAVGVLCLQTTHCLMGCVADSAAAAKHTASDMQAST
jgi:hypothetical protein